MDFSAVWCWFCTCFCSLVQEVNILLCLLFARGGKRSGGIFFLIFILQGMKMYGVYFTDPISEEIEEFLWFSGGYGP